MPPLLPQPIRLTVAFSFIPKRRWQPPWTNVEPLMRKSAINSSSHVVHKETPKFSHLLELSTDKKQFSNRKKNGGRFRKFKSMQENVFQTTMPSQRRKHSRYKKPEEPPKGMVLRNPPDLIRSFGSRVDLTILKSAKGVCPLPNSHAVCAEPLLMFQAGFPKTF